ncbi:MAG TPA: ABC transporter transmembrane domain-containing protein, partial [Flavitalea sp.]|nr:ABC transporter transmembrane domain-containing protein [Flavitalea sp.]
MARGKRAADTEELPKASVNKESIREAWMLFAYIRPYKWKFIAGLLFIVLSSLSTMAFPYLLKKLIDSAQEVITGNAPASNTPVVLVLLGILFLQMIFSFMRIYLFSQVGEHALADMRKDIFQRMIMMPMDFFARRRVGELSSRLSADLSQIQDAVTVLLAEVLRGVLTLIIGLGLIFYISHRLTFLMLSVVPVIVIIGVLFGRRIRKLSKTTQDQLADSNTIVQETLQGISNVKAFSNEWFEIARYKKSLDQVVRLSVNNGRFRGLFVSFLLFSVFGAIVLVVWYGTGLMREGALSFGDLTAFVVYTAFVGGSMAGFADMYSSLQRTLGSTQRVREILRTSPEGVKPYQEPLNEKYRLRGEVAMDEVGFTYPSRPEVQVLKNISLQVEPGQQVALVGPSGAGKSTIAALLLRFYDPSTGSIRFDGMDISKIPLTQLRQQMAVVPQDVLLFGGSILENIEYGKPGATFDQIMEAARKANAHDFISDFPEGYNTMVGERGIKLSGGQRQRIAIARAILKDPA